MRLVALCLFTNLAAPAAMQPARAQSTVLTGTVRQAKSLAPIAGAEVLGEVAVVARDSVGSYRLHLPSVTTDSNGRFALRVPRETSLLEVRRTGFFGFQFPLLVLSGDTLHVDVELRPDPLTPDLYHANGRGYLPFLCVIVDDVESRFQVLHSCLRSSYDSAAFKWRGYKHNPWSPYFGAAGDWSGVMVATRAARRR